MFDNKWRRWLVQGVSKGGTIPDEVIEESEDILTDMKRLIEELHDNSRYLFNKYPDDTL